MPRTRPIAPLLASLLLAGCGGGGLAATADPLDDVAEIGLDRVAATLEDAPDVSSVPRDRDEIDVDYVQAVMDTINEVELVTLEVLSETGDVEHPAVVPLLASTRTALQLHADLQRIEEADLDALPDELERPATEVRQVGTATRGCIHALADHAAPLLHDHPEASQPHAVVLIRSAGDSPVNPTAWVVARLSATDLEDPCPR